MPPSSTSRPNRRAARLGALALLASVLVCGPALAADRGDGAEAVRRVPPEMVGAWCPTGGCVTRAGGPWTTAGYAAALVTMLLLARRRA